VPSTCTYPDTTQKRFIQQRLEPLRSRPSYAPEFRRHILERLTAAETLERYLHTKYVGQKRFLREGGDSMIPDARHLIERAGRRCAGDGRSAWRIAAG
jgi:2-oxoglutarate dehydrogenase E1 component